MCKIITIIITELSGIMWQEGVVWTRSTLLFGIIEVNIKLIRNYIKVDCGGSDDLTAVLYPNCGVTAVLRQCDCGVTAVHLGCTDIKICKEIIVTMF